MNTTDSIKHLCVGCGNLVEMCTCDPTGQKQYESDLAFRQIVRSSLNRLEKKLDDILEGRAMTTSVDEAGICHIDGPPVNGFAIAENSDGSGNRVEVIYRIIRFQGDSMVELEDTWDRILQIIRSELQDLTSSQVNPRFSRAIIWWRRRPQFDSEQYRFSARFATTPPLPDTFWEKFGTPEGSGMIRTAKELIGG